MASGLEEGGQPTARADVQRFGEGRQHGANPCEEVIWGFPRTWRDYQLRMGLVKENRPALARPATNVHADRIGRGSL